MDWGLLAVESPGQRAACTQNPCPPIGGRSGGAGERWAAGVASCLVLVFPGRVQEGLGEKLKHAAEDAVHKAEDAIHRVGAPSGHVAVM